MPFTLDLDNRIVQNLLITLAVLVVLYVVKRIAQRLSNQYFEEPVRRYRASKFIGRATALLALAVVLIVWAPRTNTVVTVLTVIGAGLAIAMREVLLSIVGWGNIVFRSPYRQGDRIEVNGVRGDVIDIRLIHTTMMEVGGWVQADQSTGRLVHVPNSWVYQYEVYNYTRGFSFIWNELALTVTFRSDWQRAREIMLDLAQESAAIVEKQAAQALHRMAREYLVHYSILSPFVYVGVVDNGVRLTLRYLCDARKRRGTEHALTLGLLDAFKAAGTIELAYPMVGVAPLTTPQFEPLRPPSGMASPSGAPPPDDPHASS